MNGIIIFIGVVFVIAAIIVGIMSKKVNRGKTVTFLVILGILVCLAGGCFTIVPTGYTGVRETFGQISSQPVMTGFNWKLPFVQNIRLVNTKQTDVLIMTQVWGESSEKTPVYASDITVSYQISAEKAAWICANISNDTNYLLNDTLVSSAIKAAMVELPTEEVTVRSKIEHLAQEKLIESVNEKYGEDVLRIAKVTINQMDFEATYNEAISAKSIARQTQERQAIENQTAIDKAEADKKVSITKSEAEAEAARIKAEADAEVAKIAAAAEAEVIRMKAEAEAEANEKLAASLTEAILKQRFYEAWNGQLPQVMGEGTVITQLGE